MTKPVRELSEAAEVVRRYRHREVGDRYSPSRPEVMMARQERERALLRLLRQHATRALGDLRVIEIGCGSGSNLLELALLGFDPAKLVGNELLPERLAAARRGVPQATELWSGDAMELAIAPASFDVVYSSLVFSSLLNDEYQSTLANRMWTWVRPGGAVLWYDFTYDNPSNPDVRGVPSRRVRELFPEGRAHFRRVTLAPPISRRVASKWPFLYTVFNAFPLLRTHLLGWIHKA
jgi:SAM-dependent methyltransferase